MANDDEFDNGNDEGQNGNQNSGKGLRAQLESALARLQELEATNKTLASKVRTTDLATLLKSSGARAGAEKLYPKDAEVSEDAVKAWVEENAAFVRDESDGSNSNDDGSGNGQVNASEATRTNAQRLAALGDGAGQRSTGTDASNLQERMKAAKTPEELRAIYAEAGIRYGE